MILSLPLYSLQQPRWHFFRPRSTKGDHEGSCLQAAESGTAPETLSGAAKSSGCRYESFAVPCTGALRPVLRATSRSVFRWRCRRRLPGAREDLSLWHPGQKDDRVAAQLDVCPKRTLLLICQGDLRIELSGCNWLRSIGNCSVVFDVREGSFDGSNQG